VKLLSHLLVLLLTVACSPARQQVEIPFAVQYAGQPITCSSTPVALADLRLFVHDLRLGEPGEDQVVLQLATGGGWQNESVALLDFEDGQDACANGSAEINTVVRGTVSGPAPNGLEFVIGVPEALNHANPLTAEAPLSYTAMHWHWLSGYKFMRAGVGTAGDGFWMHLGSTRCEGTIRDIKGCKSPNRPTVRLPDFVAGEDEVVVDLAVLFADIDFQDGSPSRCMSEPGETECIAPFRALGVAHPAAPNEPIENQKAFSRRTRN